MKNTKKQLFTAVAMLLVATVALGTATYAWFVNNAAVEVENMDFTASSSMALDIGVNKSGSNAGTVTTGGISYGTVVSLADIKQIKDYSSFSAISLKPASADDAALKAGTFFYDKEWNTTNSAVKTYEAVAASEIGPGMVKMVPLWFRSSQDMKVWLASGSAVTASAGDPADKPGVDSDLIDRALRVSFVTPSKTLTTYAFPGDPAQAGKQVTGKNYNYIASGGTAGQGVASATPTPTFAPQTVVTSGGFTYVPNTSNVWDAAYESHLAGLEPVVQTKAGEDTLVLVYIWLEGCDEDCVTAVSGGKVDVKLNFIGQTTI